tara:strand:+ start:713 stop:1024 length:312 start_codon:yes stop_codon:yes gene_type:complete
MNQKAYRDTDPLTSRQPFERRRKKQIILEILRDAPFPLNAGEIEELGRGYRGGSGLWKRLKELEREGDIERGEQTYYVGTGKFGDSWSIKEKQLQLNLGKEER